MSDDEDVPVLVPVEETSEPVKMPSGPVPKSGRWWKSENKQRHTAIFKDKPLKSSWETKMKKKADQKSVKMLQEQIRQKLAEEKAAKAEARKEQEERRLENERKGEIVQVITNMNKLKKTKKKQLRSIQKRDTN